MDAGLSLHGAAELAREGREKLDQRIYARQRRFMEDWIDGGPITKELERAVMTSDLWTPPEFARVFGGSREAAGRLLGALGYEARRDDWGNRWWQDPSV